MEWCAWVQLVLEFSLAVAATCTIGGCGIFFLRTTPSARELVGWAHRNCRRADRWERVDLGGLGCGRRWYRQSFNLPILASPGARLSVAFLFFLFAFFSSSSRRGFSSSLPVDDMSSKCILLLSPATSLMPRSQKVPLPSIMSWILVKRAIKPSRLLESGMLAFEAPASTRSSYDMGGKDSNLRSFMKSVSMVSPWGKPAVPGAGGAGAAFGVVLRLRCLTMPEPFLPVPF